MEFWWLLLFCVVNVSIYWKIPEEHDLESQIRKEREWRFLRNARVRKQAQKIIQKGEWFPSCPRCGQLPRAPSTALRMLNCKTPINDDPVLTLKVEKVPVLSPVCRRGVSLIVTHLSILSCWFCSPDQGSDHVRSQMSAFPFENLTTAPC